MANRQYKDSVFRRLFRNKRELASLYQAIRPDDEIFAKDIRLTTLRNVFLDNQRNDLSFLWKRQAVVLMEHQSTWNENIPLRMLSYADHVYRKVIKFIEAQRAMYQEALVKIPTPKFYMLYNGQPQKKKRDELLLSDAFEEPDGDLELSVHVIDISYNKTNPILQACEPLYGYSYLVYRIQEYKRQGDDNDTAIAKAITDCIQAGILTDFLMKNGKEVIDMFKLQWNEKDAKKYWKEEARNQGLVEGRAEGRAEGKMEGRAEGKAEAARSLMESLHCTKEKAMELLKIPAELQPKIIALL